MTVLTQSMCERFLSLFVVFPVFICSREKSNFVQRMKSTEVIKTKMFTGKVNENK
jgi:hypothetical protein